ncbi:MAG: metalloregulator ArsR/SmtB family transcription factor [Gammaproteobacteria bacterium]
MPITINTLFQLLSDTTRLRCLLLLQPEGELCVCELTYALGAIQPKVSRHLAMLRQAGIVLDRRAGQWIYYRIHPDLPGWIKTILAAASKGSDDEQLFIQDRMKLVEMPNRPGSRACA